MRVERRDLEALVQFYEMVVTGDRVFAACRSDAFRRYVVGCAGVRTMREAAGRAGRMLEEEKEGKGL